MSGYTVHPISRQMDFKEEKTMINLFCFFKTGCLEWHLQWQGTLLTVNFASLIFFKNKQKKYCFKIIGDLLPLT